MFQRQSDIDTKLAAIRREGEEREAKRRAQMLRLPYADLRHTAISVEAIKVIPKDQAQNARVACIQQKGDELAVVFADPRLPAATALLEELAKRKFIVRQFIVSLSGLKEAWRYYEYLPPAPEEITGEIDIDEAKTIDFKNRFSRFQAITEAFQNLDYAHTNTTALFQLLVGAAVASRASDIHIEATQEGATVRLRIDGILHEAARFPADSYRHLMTRLKLLSELKLNVRDEPQDGRFTIKLSGVDVEVRVSIIPSEFGETAVLRILDPAAISVTLPQLGLREDDLKMVQTELQRPNGLILNTGPTGSGKTTTLYAFLRHVHTPEIKIITVEDPIEYRIEGLQQTQVDPEAGYTFASGLRSILRQDPDVILVGEIRDGETADIALQAALTGHIVFSTLHTNDAIGAVPRLIDLGVKASTVAPAVSLIIAQRLVRKLCTQCRKKVPLNEEEKANVKKFFESLPPRVDRTPYNAFLEGAGEKYEAVGCDACNGFGYKGRIGIFEFFRKNEEAEEVIIANPTPSALRKLARAQQMVTMQQDGVLKSLLGVTTLQEVEEVTGPIEWK